VKKLLKAKKFEIVALILMSFEQQAVSFQRNIKNFNSSGRVMYINHRTKNKKMPNHYLPATLKPMPSTLVDNPVRDKNLAIK
jgi:hypothetical protein